MARWEDLETSAPELAQGVRQRFEAHRHAILATVRRDGSPRVSGIETTFAQGDLWLGMMLDSLKARDLRRDPRLALHTTSVDPPEDPTAWVGDAKVSGRADEITDPARSAEIAREMAGGSDPQAEAADQGAEAAAAMHLFRVDVTEAVLTRVASSGDHLVIELWRPGEEVRRTNRT